ncbi:hypothetical protein [Shimia abyssi]|uniref:Uncharacterized protein n=1 Tax=Shimia abyssi TaxID=1662395 RepID=A0A2P8FFA2_9RHOB|nr:hypothetical protein [Shimia abyssi]PSL20400.1 hypothetical protein CLV88_10341 [Shimia abyssi]
MTNQNLTYPGGLPALLDRYEGRRAPFDFGPEDLPALDCDLHMMKDSQVSESATERQKGEPNTSWSRKRREIAREFVGNTELTFLNAQLISNLRKRDFPRQTPALFRRLWAEEANHLIPNLNLRWLVSSVQTFADHGDTLQQREIGHALRMLFGVMKLYEFERTYSGHKPGKDFGLGGRTKARLPLDMQPFALRNGGLDINLIAPIWEMAEQEPVVGPLACHLLNELNSESGGVFRRLKIMRDKLERRRADK